MNCAGILFTQHALQQMLDRDIDDFHVRQVIRTGDIIEQEPDAWPLPKFVILGAIGDRAVHVVVAQHAASRQCVMITVYWPDSHLWDESFRERRQP